MKPNNARRARVIAWHSCLSLLLAVAIAALSVKARVTLAASGSPLNRIEQAATPRAFSYLTVSNNSGPATLNLNGRIFLSEQSDGLDPGKDRLVVSFGGSVVVLEPGSLRPSGQSNRVWVYQNAKAPRLRKLILQRATDKTWQFEISAVPFSTTDERFFLRIGNDWGGIDLTTGQLILETQFVLDFAFGGQAAIGAAGGTLQTTDAAGVVIRLDVPSGALTEDVLIRMTPLAASPLAGSSGALRPGVQFDPDGLQFAIPAKLTFDFSATTQQVTDKDFIFLITSPSTMVPLYGSVDLAAKTLTASMYHFSDTQPGEGSSSFADLVAWADSVLQSGQNLTLAELQSLAGLAALQQQLGCDQNCIDLGELAERARESIEAIVGQSCPIDTATPTDAALTRYVELEDLAQRLGVSVPSIRNCMEGVLGALIDLDGATAVANPSDANLQRLVDRKALAQALGFSNLESLALEKLDAALRALLNNGKQACNTNVAQGLTLLNRDSQWAPTVSTVDAMLAADIQAAKDDCGGTAPPQLTPGIYFGQATVDFGTDSRGNPIRVSGSFSLNLSIGSGKVYVTAGTVNWTQPPYDIIPYYGREYFVGDLAAGNTATATSTAYEKPRYIIGFYVSDLQPASGRTITVATTGSSASGSISTQGLASSIQSITFNLQRY